MFRNILVPLDGSPFGEHAVSVAYAIARPAGAAVHLVRVHEPLGSMVPATSSVNDLAEVKEWNREVAERESEYLRALAERTARELPVSTRLLHGAVLEALEAEARRIAADLVVMTTHGRGGIARAWLGSVADGLVRRLHAPVLLVRPEVEADRPCEEPGFRRIAVPLDGSRLAESVVEPVVRMARLTKARLVLLQVVPPPHAFDTTEAPRATPPCAGLGRLREEADAYLARVAGELVGRGVQATTQVLVDARPAHAIARFAQDAHAELVALATHGCGGPARPLLGSIADKVMRTAPVPVLLLRPGVAA